MKFFEGKDHFGVPQTSEGFKNVLTGQEVMPEKGHNGEPPCPTGDLATVRHSGDAYKQGWERIWGSKETGEVIGYVILEPFRACSFEGD